MRQLNFHVDILNVWFYSYLTFTFDNNQNIFIASRVQITLYNGIAKEIEKVMPPEFKHNMCFVLICISYKFQNIWLGQTKVRKRKPISGMYTCMYVRKNKSNIYCPLRCPGAWTNQTCLYWNCTNHTESRLRYKTYTIRSIWFIRDWAEI